MKSVVIFFNPDLARLGESKGQAVQLNNWGWHRARFVAGCIGWGFVVLLWVSNSFSSTSFRNIAHICWGHDMSWWKTVPPPRHIVADRV